MFGGRLSGVADFDDRRKNVTTTSMRGQVTDEPSVLLHAANKLKEEAREHDRNIDYWRVLLENLEAEFSADLVGKAVYKDSKRELTRNIKRNLKASKRKMRRSKQIMKSYHKAIRRQWDIP